MRDNDQTQRFKTGRGEKIEVIPTFEQNVVAGQHKMMPMIHFAVGMTDCGCIVNSQASHDLR